MRIRVLAFASAKDALGRDELELDLPAGTSLGELQTLLSSHYPKLLSLWPRLALALNGTLVAQETPLSEGAEVALLPPVSGGNANSDFSFLSHEPIDISLLLGQVSNASDGALVLFVGKVRNRQEGQPVHHLSYSAYDFMAEQSIARIVQELEAAYPSRVRIAMIHRLGELAVGEISIAIATASPHRALAYQVSREAIERIKKEVPIWKQEYYEDGTKVWREEESLEKL